MPGPTRQREVVEHRSPPDSDTEWRVGGFLERSAEVPLSTAPGQSGAHADRSGWPPDGAKPNPDWLVLRTSSAPVYARPLLERNPRSFFRWGKPCAAAPQSSGAAAPQSWPEAETPSTVLSRQRPESHTHPPEGVGQIRGADGRSSLRSARRRRNSTMPRRQKAGRACGTAPGTGTFPVAGY